MTMSPVRVPFASHNRRHRSSSANNSLEQPTCPKSLLLQGNKPASSKLTSSGCVSQPPSTGDDDSFQESQFGSTGITADYCSENSNNRSIEIQRKVFLTGVSSSVDNIFRPVPLCFEERDDTAGNSNHKSSSIEEMWTIKRANRIMEESDDDNELDAKMNEDTPTKRQRLINELSWTECILDSGKVDDEPFVLNTTFSSSINNSSNGILRFR